MALTTKRAIILFLSERHLSRKERHLYFLPCQMHQKRTKKLFLLNTWRMALTTKRAIILFLSERHLSRKKNVICTFCLAKCIRKGQKKCSFWLHEEWLSPQKEQFFFSFLNVIFVEKKRHLYFLPCQMHQKRTKKLFLLTTWRMALTTKRAIIFLSERHLSRKERNLYFLPCQMHQKRTQKLLLLTTWRMALTTKRTIFLFFSERHLSRKNVICTFCLAKCITKGQTNCSFWLHEEWLSPQKERFFCSFLNVVFLEKVICTFCLAKCIRKGQQQKIPFDYMKNGSHHKKSNYFVPFWTSYF